MPKIRVKQQTWWKITSTSYTGRKRNPEMLMQINEERKVLKEIEMNKIPLFDTEALLRVSLEVKILGEEKKLT